MSYIRHCENTIFKSSLDEIKFHLTQKQTNILYIFESALKKTHKIYTSFRRFFALSICTFVQPGSSGLRLSRTAIKSKIYPFNLSVLRPFEEWCISFLTFNAWNKNNNDQYHHYSPLTISIFCKSRKILHQFYAISFLNHLKKAPLHFQNANLKLNEITNKHFFDYWSVITTKL
jgi:hypothetical protein